jgi:two-component system phosphate regulon sensor histidine kinase PhoR
VTYADLCARARFEVEAAMRRTVNHHWIEIASLVVSATFATVWTVEMFLPVGSLGLRIALFCGGLAAASLAVFGFSRQRQKEKAAAIHFVDQLTECDLHRLSEQLADNAGPVPESAGMWSEVLLKVRHCVGEIAEKLHAAEQSRTRAEVRMRRTSAEGEQVGQILSSLPEAVMAIDQYDEVVLTNPSAVRLLQLQDDDSTESRALSQLVHCEALVELLTETRRHKTAIQRTGELQIDDEDGHAQWYRATVRSLGNNTDGGESKGGNGAVAVLRDISTQKSMQKRNAEFVSAVSHEMKTPLCGIKAYVELLIDGDAEDDDTRDEFLGVIDSQADRLQRLVDNMLNIARIEAGVVNVDKQPHPINEILDEALDVVEPSAERKSITLVRDLSPMFLEALADRDMLLQSAINLLSNAIKYTADGGQVRLTSRMADGGVEFEVADTGVGLSEEDAQRVFEKFYRVKKDSEMAAGTGLGLPLAKHIVEDVHSGSLTVESRLGEGSTFKVSVPKLGGR